MNDREERLAEIKARHLYCDGVAYMQADGELEEEAGEDMDWLIRELEETREAVEIMVEVFKNDQRMKALAMVDLPTWQAFENRVPGHGIVYCGLVGGDGHD